MGKAIEWFNAAGERWCSGCRTWMAVDLFPLGGPTAHTPDKRSPHCRVCRRHIRRAFYRRHRDKEIAASLAWRAANPERYKATQREASKVGRRMKKVRRELAALMAMEGETA